mmetsp:Transcript_35404/g.100253  ORF Transcript_35404/g.100253 Transcript_35404/m.100253 type:complete len:447 (-) Transcript_35404:190-1530(-)
MSPCSASCARSAGVPPTAALATACRRVFDVSNAPRLASRNRPLSAAQRNKFQARRPLSLRSGQGYQGCTKLQAVASAELESSTTSITTIEVPFSVPFGRSLKVVGSHPTLGKWNPDEGLALEWSEGDIWKAEVALPAGTWEFKAVVVGGPVDEWEGGDNRVIEVTDEVLSLDEEAQAEASELIAEINGFSANESLEEIFPEPQLVPEPEVMQQEAPLPEAAQPQPAADDAAVTRLQQQVDDLARERDELRSAVEAYKNQAREGQESPTQESQAASVASALDLVDHAHTTAVQKASSADPTQQGALWRLHEELAGSVRQIRAQLADGIPAQSSSVKPSAGAEAQVQALKQKLAEVQARSGLPVTQMSNHTAQLEKRIAELEANEKAQKKRWQEILAKTEQLHELEQAEWQLVVEEKDREIRRFRSELDSILRELSKVGPAQNNGTKP